MKAPISKLARKLLSESPKSIMAAVLLRRKSFIAGGKKYKLERIIKQQQK